MKTTLELEPDLLAAAKRKALEEGTSLKGVVEEALVAHLGRAKKGTFRLRRVTFSAPRLQVEGGWGEIAEHLYPPETGSGRQA